jgi:hypothetical protein
LADADFTVIAVALDENLAAVAPFTEDITYPVLVDTEHQMSELYAITNVPTVVWIDENDRIVRPNAMAVAQRTRPSRRSGWRRHIAWATAPPIE